VTSRERIVLKLGPKGKVVEPIAIETKEGTYTIEKLQLKVGPICDPRSGHAAGEMVLVGSGPYKRRPKAGKK
jgi:hypothetical protein